MKELLNLSDQLQLLNVFITKMYVFLFVLITDLVIVETTLRYGQNVNQL